MRRPFVGYVFLSIALALMLSIVAPARAQHEGHVMPRVTKQKSKPKPRVKRKRKSITSRNAVHRAKKTTSRSGNPNVPKTSMPGPAEATFPTAPKKAIVHDPSMHTPVTETPAVSPSSPAPHEGHTQTVAPSSSGTPHPVQTTPAPQHVHPSTSMKPSADSVDHSKMTPAEHGESLKGSAIDDHSMSLGPLMVMSGDRMSIRVGNSETNLMPMGQMASGTAWSPASTPSYMLHKQSGDWLLMFHYNAVLGANAQGGQRGVTKVESANWFMPMALRRVGKGTLELRSMFSFEPFTFPPGGSPLLFQTGETYKGQPIIDRQHPHDLFMELSASYTVALGEQATWFTYFGYPGEPALGPVAFMHRASASENSSAPLSHHLQDSSHISFGVLTTGFTYRGLKLEGSVFNGREPDENRYNFEAHPWSSRSVRLSYAPNSNWSLQVSHGFLRNPEAAEPGDVRRTTASISYNRPFTRGNWATTLIWGRNHESHGDEIFNLNGYTGESTLNFLEKNYLYTRIELVDKNQLLRAADRLVLGITHDHPSFRIGAYTFGGARDIWTTRKMSLAIGGDVTFYSKPEVLDAIYGVNPASWKFYFRVRPAKMDMAGMH